MIVTVTLNPAVDEEYLVPEFRPGSWFRATSVNRSAGGKGINVSILLRQMGCDSAALGFLAGYNGEYVRDALRRERITTNFVNVRGETRTNTYVVDEVGHVETGIAELGPYIPEEALSRFFRNYERILHRADGVVMGGSLPPGVPQDIFRELTLLARRHGKPVFIDASGSPLLMALEGGPTVAKIDHRFMSLVMGVPLSTLDNLIGVAQKIHSQGVPWVVASYRTYGDLFSTPEGVFIAEVERKGIVSLFGASDALLAGLVLGLGERMPAEDAIRFAMAAALEDAMHMEKGVRSRASVEQHLSKVKLDRVG